VEDAFNATLQALKVGYRHIDTAHDYCADGSTAKIPKFDPGCGNVGCPGGKTVQSGIGAAIQQSKIAREDLYITTKIPGCGTQGIGFDTCSADSVAAHHSNLAELDMTYTDLLLIHFPPSGGCQNKINCDAMQAQWRALITEVRDKNLTKSLGVSNMCISCLECLAAMANPVTPAVNQVQFHVGMGADPGGLLSYSAGKGIVVEAYSPLGTNTSELIHGKLTTEIGDAHNKSSPEVALRWILQHIPAVTTKSGNPVHLKEDLDITEWSLTEAETRRLDAMDSPKGTPSFMCTA